MPKGGGIYGSETLSLLPAKTFAPEKNRLRAEGIASWYGDDSTAGSPPMAKSST